MSLLIFSNAFVWSIVRLNFKLFIIVLWCFELNTLFFFLIFLILFLISEESKKFAKISSNTSLLKYFVSLIFVISSLWILIIDSFQDTWSKNFDISDGYHSFKSGKFLKTLFIIWLYLVSVNPSVRLYLLSSSIIFELLDFFKDGFTNWYLFLKIVAFPFIITSSFIGNIVFDISLRNY